MQAFLALALVACAAGQDYSAIQFTVANAKSTEGSPMNFYPRIEHSLGSGNLWASGSGPSFDIEIVPGTATADDFPAVQDQTSFQFVHDSSKTVAPFAVQTVQDNIVESDETFTVNIAMTSDGFPGFPVIPDGTIQGTIIDDEGLTVQLADAIAVEGVDSQFVFTVTLSHEIGEDVTLSIGIDNANPIGTDAQIASIDSDYENIPNELFFAANTKSATFSIDIIDDNVQENVETFEVVLGMPSKFDYDWAGPNNFATGMFAREDEGVTVCVESITMAEAENAAMEFEVTLSHHVHTDVAVYLKTADGVTNTTAMKNAASALVHYDPVSSAVRTFPKPGTNTVLTSPPEKQTLSVDIINDNVQSSHSQAEDAAASGPVHFALHYSLDPNVYGGGTGTAMNAWNVRPCGVSTIGGVAYGNIYDFEDVTISLTGGDQTLTENDSNPWTFTVKLSHTIGARTNELTSGIVYSFVDLNPAENSTYYGATVERNLPKSVNCADLSNDVYPAADVCWPAGVIPQNVGNGYNSNTQYTNYTMVPGADAASLDRVITFAHGPTDFLVEGQESFTVGLALDFDNVYNVRYDPAATTTSDGKILISTSYIDDDEKASFTYSAASSVAEAEGHSLSFDVTLSHRVSRDFSVSWTTMDGTAIRDRDFSLPASTEVTWTAYSDPTLAKVATVSILNDNIQELAETFHVKFNAVDNGMISAAEHSIMGTITDDESLTLSVNDMFEAKDESSLDWIFTVTLSHAASYDLSFVRKSEVDALLPTASRRASASRFDGTEVTEAVPARTTEVAFRIDVINDNIQHGVPGSVQQFLVSVDTTQEPTITTENSKLSGVALISDDEGVSVSLYPITRAEEADLSMVFSVELSHLVSEDVKVAYSTVDNDMNTCTMNCAGPNDYVGVSGSSVTIAANAPSADISIVIVNDKLQEFMETFAMVLENTQIGEVDNAVAFTDTAAIATILDEEKAQMSIADAKGDEGEDLVFTITLTHEADTDITVEYKIYDGTAKKDLDYVDKTHDANSVTSTPGQLVIPKGSTSAFITVAAVDDQIAEVTEGFTVSLLSMVAPSGIYAFVPVKGLAEGSIGTLGGGARDEDLTISITDSLDVTRTEDLVFTVRLSHAIADEVSGHYETINASAVSGVDYAYQLVNFVFEPAGTDIPASQVLKTQTFIPACQEKQATETMTMQLNFDAGSALLSAGNIISGTGSVLPFDHSPTVSITGGTANEGEDIVFSVTLSHCVDEGINVGYAYKIGGSANPGVDFNVPAAGYVTMAADSDGATTTTFAVEILNDNVQGLQKEFQLELVTPRASNKAAGNSDIYGVTFNSGLATGFIDDNEFATITITTASGSNSMFKSPTVGDTDYVFTVTLSHAVSSHIELAYTTEDDTAEAGLDYVKSSGILSFLPSQSSVQPSKTITVNGKVREDVVRPTSLNGVMPPTRFNVKVAESDGYNTLGDYQVSLDGTAVGGIGGKDNTNLVVDRVTFTEGERGLFKATLEHEVATDVTLRWTVVSTTTSGKTSADPETDFEQSQRTGLITFPKNAGSFSREDFTVQPADDWLVETNEYFNLQFEVVEPAGYENVIDMVTNVAKNNVIVDNDKATLMVEDATAEEASGALSFKVTLSHFAVAEVSATVTPSSSCGLGTACFVTGDTPPMSPDADVLNAEVTLITFVPKPENVKTDAPNSQFASVALLNDNVQEPAETFTMTAAVVSSGGMLAADGHVLEGTGTIADDEGTLFIFTPDGEGSESRPVTGEEGDVFRFFVGLTHEVANAFQVNYMTPQHDGSEFIYESITNGVLTLSSSAATNFIPVQTVDNFIYSPDEIDFEVVVVNTVPDMNIGGMKAQGVIAVQNEGAVLEVSCDAAAEDEGAKLLFNVALSHALSRSMEFSYETSDLANEAIAGVDYEAVAPASHTFSGDLSEGAYVQEVNILNDNIVERDEKVGFAVAITTEDFKAIGIQNNEVNTICANGVQCSTGVITDTEEGFEITLRDSKVAEAIGAQMVFTAFLTHQVGENTDFKMTYTVAAAPGQDDDHTPRSEDTLVPAFADQAGKDFDATTNAESSRFANSGEGNDCNEFQSSHPACGKIVVPISDDYIVEFDEYVQLDVHSLSFSTYKINTLKVVGTIADNEDATISITNAYDHSETVSPATLTVTLSHIVQPGLQVSYETVDSGATSSTNRQAVQNTDFQALEGTLTFSGAFSSLGNSKTQNVEIEIFDDHVVEEDYEEFFVSLTGVRDASDLGIRVDADEYAGIVVLTYDEESATVYVDGDKTAEEGSDMLFKIMLSHPVQSSDVRINYQVGTVGSAGAGGATLEDFSCLGGCAGERTISASVITGTPLEALPVEVSALRDDITEFAEVFEFRITDINDGNALEGIVETVPLSESTLSVSEEFGVAYGTIQGQDGAVPLGQLTILDGEAEEAAGNFVEFKVLFPRYLDGHEPVTDPVSFSWQTSRRANPEVTDNAEPGQDFIAESGTETLLPNEEEKIIRIAVVDNDLVQGTHTFIVNIKSVVPIARSSAVGSITESDTTTVSISDAEVAEEEGAVARFKVSLSAPVDSNFTFFYSLDRTMADDIFISEGARDGNVTIAAKTTEVFLEVPIKNDDVQENTETFTVEAETDRFFVHDQEHVSPDSIKWGRSSATGTITDDEGVLVSLKDTDATEFIEGESAVFTVQLSHVVELADNFVLYKVTSGSANNEDFRVSEDRRIVFSADSGRKEEKRIIILTVDDHVAEPDETFTVQLEAGRAKIAVDPLHSSRTITILNDDFATISIADVQGSESNNKQLSTMEFAVTLSHEVAGVVSVVATTQDVEDGSLRAEPAASAASTAALNTEEDIKLVPYDYIKLNNQPFSISHNPSRPTTIPISIFDDQEQECDEQFEVVLSSIRCKNTDGSEKACGNYVSFAKHVGTGTLANDDEGLQLSISSAEQTEAQSPFTFNIELSHAVSRGFTFHTYIAASEESFSRLPDYCVGKLGEANYAEACKAKSLVEYEIKAHRPAILNVAKMSFDASVAEDTIAQGPGIFTVAVDNNEDQLGWKSQCGKLTVIEGVGTIQDDEQATIELFSAQAWEDGDHLMEVKLSHKIETELEVGFLVTGAGADTDFTSTTGTITFSPNSNGGMASQASVEVLPDVVSESDEEYTVQLTNVPMWLKAEAPATLTILNDEVTKAGVKVTALDAIEGEPVVFKFELTTKDHELVVAFQYETVTNTAGGGAEDGVDFVRTTGDLQWGPGDDSPRYVIVDTIHRHGCHGVKTMQIRLHSIDKFLSDRVGGSHTGAVFQDGLAQQNAYANIHDKDGAALRLIHDSSVASGTDFTVTAELSETCDFDIEVMVEAGSDQELCTIKAQNTGCNVVLTSPSEGSSFELAVIELEERNPAFASVPPDVISVAIE